MFEKIIGHKRQKAFLLSLVEKNRLPQALLFAGPSGTGKKLVARGFAQTLFCESHTGCGYCRGCVNIIKGVHPDLVVLEGEETIGIEQSRLITREVFQQPFEAPRRIVIIDEVERMTSDALNALLKTLEEPPEYNVIILVTSRERDVPLTIRSRCQRVAFGPLTESELKEFFLTSGLDVNKAALMGLIAEGSIQSALFWMNDDNFALRRKIAGLLLDSKKSFLRTTLYSEKLSEDGKKITMFLYFLLSFYRDLYILSVTGEAQWIINKDVEDLMKSHEPDRQRILSAMESVHESIRTLRYNVNKLVLAESLLLRLTRYT